MALKRAAVSVDWELVGGAVSLDELDAQLATWAPDVVAIDAGLGADAPARVKERLPRAQVAVIGADQAAGQALSRDEVRAAILGLPRPGGPVRG